MIFLPMEVIFHHLNKISDFQTALVTVATEVRHTRAQMQYAREREKSNRE